jgi:ABC-type Fe3+/spermidine/putrescine transport system ATPase subunit
MQIALESLSKRYSKVRALDNVSLEIEAGQIVSILGPNGAGKTTLLRCLSGIVAPTSGDIRYDGERFYRGNTAVRRRIAYLSDFPIAFPNITVLRHLAAEAQVVQLNLHRTQTGLDVAQTFPIGQLGEGHGQILIPAGKSTQPDVAPVALDATAKLTVGKEADRLREDGTALVHEPLSAVPGAQTSRSKRSNRGKFETDSTHYWPITYRRSTLL